MFDHRELRGRIVARYGKVNAFCAALGFYPGTISQKLNGKLEFRPTEIWLIAKELDIPQEQIGFYFFTKMEEVRR